MLNSLKAVCVFVFIVCLVVVTACEDEPDDTDTTTTTPTTTTTTTPTNSAGVLYILPTSAMVSTNAGDAVTFRATGGTSPYTFAVSDGALGSVGTQTVNSDGSADVVYTSKAGTGNNTLTVTDAAAATQQATISHSN